MKRQGPGVSQVLLVTYFFYGLAFFAMGLAMLLETGRSPALAEARSLRLLAAFGLLHGTHEWLESYLILAQDAGTTLPTWLAWLRLVLLISSFLALFGYAYLTLRLASPRYQGHRLLHFDRLAIYEVVVLLAVSFTYIDRPVQWITLLDGMARYMLALPAAALAGLSLITQGRNFRREQRIPLSTPLIRGGLGFAVYAAGQLFVHSMNAFPAEYVNLETFVAWVGIPIQIVRTVAALIITTALLEAVQIMEKERQAELVEAQRARLDALEQRDLLRRDLLQHVVRSQEDERARVARELHDEVAQQLSAFSLELSALKARLKRADTNKMVDHLLHLSRQMNQGLYRLVRDLRPSNLDDLGLVPALNSLISQNCQQKGMAVHFKVIGNQQRLNPLVETVLFRVAQEALNNVCRHAGVAQVEMELEYDCSHVAIRVIDHGVGFDPSENFHPPRGWGLAGMRERVESLAGKLTLQSAPGAGTRVEVLIPLKDEMGKELIYGQYHTAPGG